MKKRNWLLAAGVLIALFSFTAALFAGSSEANERGQGQSRDWTGSWPYRQEFEVTILVDGRPLSEYPFRGKTYVEAIRGAEYDVRIRNPFPYRVAVALSVDGLNSIDALRTSAWNASKWVMQPYETIQISGWQVSSGRARRFYFTNEQDSYGAKLGQTSNLGVVSAVFFREHRRETRVVPPPRPKYEPDTKRDGMSAGPPPETQSQAIARDKKASAAPIPDDYAATGIGRSVSNNVQWVNMDLESRPAAEVTIRYEYYEALVRLGVLPRRYSEPDALRRREGARGFEDRRFSPEP